jgi:hypothetical protein
VGIALLVVGCGRHGYELAGPGGVNADAGPAGADAGPIDDLVVAFDCEVASPDHLLDSSGAGRDGECEAGSCPALEPGRSGSACVLDGTVVVTVPGSADVETATGFTVAAWVRPEAVLDRQIAIATRPDPSGSTVLDSWALFVTTSETPVLETNNGSDYQRLSSGSVPLGTWTHVAATYTPPNERRLYVNGVETASDTATVVLLGGPVVIGADQDMGTFSHQFDGALDDFRFYARALSASELAALAM